MTSTQVVDLSHWNTVSSFASVKTAGVGAVIHKASEGDYNTDPMFVSRRDAARSVGLLYGAYHFATNDDVDDQVDRFLGVVGDDPDLLLALDLEDYGSNSMSLSQARDWIEEVEERTGRSCVLYSGNRIKELLGNTVDPWWGSHRLWLAHYASQPTLPASWSEYWLWQFTDEGSISGISGDVDCNNYQGDDLTVEWSGGQVEAPPTRPPRPDRPHRPHRPHRPTEMVQITLRLTLPRGSKVEIVP